MPKKNNNESLKIYNRSRIGTESVAAVPTAPAQRKFLKARRTLNSAEIASNGDAQSSKSKKSGYSPT